jgi:outer membrane protein OmpA-like peptidoglycan-associated protein
MLGRVRGYKPSLVMGADRPARNGQGEDRAERAGPSRRSAGPGERLVARALWSDWSQPAVALRRALVVGGLVALTGCQSLEGLWTATPAPLDAGPPKPAVASREYPSLHTVPPRPQLSYSVQQRRAIVDGLIADRENARYTDQVVRYRSGQSSLPPPPTPPKVVAAAVPEGPIEPVESETEAAEPDAPAPSFEDDDGGRFRDQYEDDTLGDFVDELARDPDEDVPAAAGASSEGEGEEGPGLLDWFRGLFGQAEVEAAEPPADAPAAPGQGPNGPQAPGLSEEESSADAAIDAPAIDHPKPVLRPSMAVKERAAVASPMHQAEAAGPAPAPPKPGGVGVAIGADGVAIGDDGAAGERRAPGAGPPPSGQTVARPSPGDVAASILVLFQPGSAALPPGTGARLEQVLATAKAQGAVIRIEGEAYSPALALARARAVALGLMRIGASAGDLQMTLAPDATGDQARLILAGPAAR